MSKRLIIPAIIFSSCDYINTDSKRIEKVEAFKHFFYKNQYAFEQIAKRISEDGIINLRTGEWIEPNEFDDLTNKQLTKLNIQYVTINKTDCGQLELDFKTEWIDYPIGQLYLSKDCSDKKATKDRYQKVGSFNEVWGLEDNWLIWVDSDFI